MAEEVPTLAEPVRELRLAPHFLLIALLPAAVLVGSDLLLTRYGFPVPEFAKLGLSFDAHAEAAARVRIVTGFLVLAVAASAAAGYFAVLMDGTDRRTRGMTVGAAFLLLAVAWFAYFERHSPYQTQEFVGQRLVCEAAMRPAAMDLGVSPAPPADELGRPAAYVPDNCAAKRFRYIRSLIDAERTMLFVALPAVIFGAILTLARPSPASAPEGAELPDQAAVRRKQAADEENAVMDESGGEAEDDPRRRLLQIQINRLNTVLYLSAFLLVGGLLFLSAFLHYPAFLVEEGRQAAFQQHVGSLVLFYAVSYSLLIASFYVPVAAMLARECALLKQAPEEAEGNGMLAPTQLLRVGIAIFSPMIVGALGEAVALPI